MTDALRALVAEDEPAMLSLVTRHLRELGFQVVDASDGDTAWDLAQQHTPDLVLLDVMMPGMSGWEICKRLKNHAQNGGQFTQTGVIMLTGIGENLNEMTSPLFAADAWLNKPFEFGDLDSKIREVLSSYDKSLPDGDAAGERAPDSSTGSNASGALDDEDDEPEDDPETIVDRSDASSRSFDRGDDDDDDEPAPAAPARARARAPKSGPRAASVTGLAVAVAKTVAKKVGAAAKKVAKAATKAVAKKKAAPAKKAAAKKAPAKKAAPKKAVPKKSTKAVAAKGRKPAKATGAKKVAKKAAARPAAKAVKRGAKKR